MKMEINMKKNLLNLFFYSLLSFQGSVYAVEKIEVQGLFANKAVLLIDGNRHILAVGKTSPEGVKIISADSHAAVLEVDGKQKQYFLGNKIY